MENQIATVTSGQGFPVELLLQNAIDKGTPIETMERLLVMRRELKAEAAKEAFDSAMARFQGLCPVIEKKKKVFDKFGKLRYCYAPLDEIIEQVKDLIASEGLSYDFDTIQDGEAFVTAVCRVTHASGHTRNTNFRIPVDKNSFMSGPQKFGAALTFGKRYAFCNAFGIATGDEDTDAVDVDKKDDDAPKAPPAPPAAPAAAPVSKFKYTPPPAAVSAGEAKTTAAGNPVGTITEAQSKKIFMQMGVLGVAKEKVDEWTMQTFSSRISGLSKDAAMKVIDALEKKIEAQKPTAPVDPTVVPLAPVADEIALQDIAASFGGHVVDENTESVGMQKMREAYEQSSEANRAV